MDDFVIRLKTLGFTDYEAKIFLGLFQGHQMSASEIADSAGVRRTDVYPILKSFVEKGYCNEIDTNTILKYELIDPDVILDKILLNIQNEKEKQIKNFNETFKNLKPHFRSKSEESKTSHIELIRGYNQHREAKFFELLKNAKKEILFMIRLEMYISEEVDETAAAFIRNGGVIKSIYEVNGTFKVRRNDKWTEVLTSEVIEIFKKFQNYGEQVRLSKKKIPNFTIFDREVVFMNITDKTVPRYNEADIIVKNRDYAESMAEVFSNVWERSLTLEDYKKK
ncbi:MAG: helix-turn-helix domain-containing protein [Ignavibacteria bacterium]|nr:helix-turn-helix domain-containing protein [Ignavibacteria bacterium]